MRSDMNAKYLETNIDSIKYVCFGKSQPCYFKITQKKETGAQPSGHPLLQPCTNRSWNFAFLSPSLTKSAFVSICSGRERYSAGDPLTPWSRRYCRKITSCITTANGLYEHIQNNATWHKTILLIMSLRAPSVYMKAELQKLLKTGISKGKLKFTN